MLRRSPRSIRPRPSSTSIEKQTAALEVRAGIAGQVAQLPVGPSGPMQVGTHVPAGTPVAEVIQLNKLKAALQIAETQAHDIQIGQPASIDTHNGDRSRPCLAH